MHPINYLKNKDLPGSGQARSQQTYAINFNTDQDDDSNNSGNYIEYNICSINQYGEPFISGYNANEYDNNDPDSVLIANTATNLSLKASNLKRSSRNLSSFQSLRSLRSFLLVLCDYLLTKRMNFVLSMEPCGDTCSMLATPKMVETDKESNTTYNIVQAIFEIPQSQNF